MPKDTNTMVFAIISRLEMSYKNLFYKCDCMWVLKQ